MFFLGSWFFVSTKHKAQSTSLWEYPPHTRCFNYSADCENVSSGPHVDVVTLGSLMHGIKGGVDRLFESLVDLAFRPEERILVLHPFVVTDSDAACVRENVRHQEHAFVSQHSIGAWRCWTIRQLGDDLRFHFVDILERYRVFERRRQQDVAINRNQVVRVHLFRAAQPSE